MFELLQESHTSTAALPASALNPESLQKAANDLWYRCYEWIRGRCLVTSEEPSRGLAGSEATLPFARSAEVDSLKDVLPEAHIRPDNLKAIRFLDEWFAEPDDLGDEFWDEFDRELRQYRFTIP